MIRTPQAHVTQTNHGTSKLRSSPDRAIADYQDPVLEKYESEDFAWLSSEASRLRTSKERLPGGYWKLRALYDAIEQPPAGDLSESAWTQLFAKLGRWREQQPQDITPVVALASAWREYGWQARGNGYADTVSPSAWSVFHERLDKAAQLLDEANGFSEQCPEFYHEALRLGPGLGWNRGELDRYFAEGTALEPTYYYLHQQKALYMLPRWGGKEGEWEQFADDSARNIGGKQGDIVFFAIYSLMRNMNDMSFMPRHRQAAPQLIAGFRAIEELYGASQERLNEACLASLFIDDPTTTAELFDRTEKDLDENVWHGRNNFEGFRNTFRQQQRVREVQSQRPPLITSSN